MCFVMVAGTPNPQRREQLSRGRPISEMPVDPTAILRRSQNDVDDLAATEGPKQLFFVWDFRSCCFYIEY